MRRTIVVLLLAVTLAVLVPLAASRRTPAARGQTVPPGGGPVTTPQPTVPCTPLDGCGKQPAPTRDVAYAWIDRYCDGSAVPTPPGQTTFALSYGLGGQTASSAQFTGVLQVDGVEMPTAPLLLLQPGERDTRIRTAVIPSGAVLTVTLTVASTTPGVTVLFGNGQTSRVRMASGACPGVVSTTPPAPPVTTAVPVTTTTTTTPAPPSSTVPPATNEIPPAR